METNTNKRSELKAVIISNIDSNKENYIRISHDIHNNPELGNQEFFASTILTEVLSNEGFNIEKSVAGHPTSFIARKKSKEKKGPIIGFLAEYDALPNLGHACGHNIIGTTSVAAAISLSKVIDKVGGEVVVLGTPAEEGGENGSAKGSFVKYNLLKGIDACLIAHPGSRNCITSDSLAVDPLDFEFIGKSAHAAACPEKGINALEGVIQLFNGINALRQHLSKDVSIHGIITHGGDAPNIVPEYAKARFFIRAATRIRCDEVTNKVRNIAKGAALATGSKVNIIAFQNKVDNMLKNRTLDNIFVESLNSLGVDIDIKKESNVGSSDVGNISHVVPTIQPNIKIGPDTLVGHTKEFCDAAISEQGDIALITGAKALALTGFCLLADEDKLKSIKDEFSRVLAEK
ncbi:M20 family metallopeptidase [Clostridium estertheticum]|uniref:Peptidase M20 domain-containing protein 2 n=1 Tax=Clostridium estertheticum TaxID=238834 RepID=A0AA47EN60_9CLOT|nr:M20 family metallopeptidase [Clostridium estertheticum]MBU3154487.1 M20 family metallopeptidase [Clostridium estertheticum]WAG62076.1 M20 family metallopeptidase [Clostridium estertheticum]